ncbi:MAG TPA: peptidylprolyl isomerase [Acidisarcina sp.]
MKFRSSQFPSSSRFVLLFPRTSATGLALFAILAGGVTLSTSTAGAQTARSTGAPAVSQASTQASPFGGTIVEDVIARVNDQIISRADFERAEQDLEQRAKQQNLTPAQVEAERKDLLRDLVDQQLLLSKGKELDINGETELIRELNEIRKENHLDTMEDLQKAAESQGVNYEDFKANIRNRIITQQVIRDQVGRRLNITQADVQRYYEKHKSEYIKPESVRLDEIMIPATDPAAVPAAMAKANDFETRLKAGADFDSLVKEASAGSASPEGGDLGSFQRGKLSKVLEDKTFAVKAGEITEPIQTRQGVIILKVTEHTAGGQAPPLKDVQPQVEDALAQERVQPAVRAYLAEARQEAYIVYKPGFVDSAAVVSPNPIVYSAYTPPATKKKKKVNRTRYRGRVRRGSDTQTASAPLGGPLGAGAATGTGGAPAGVPSLADAPHGTPAGGETAAAGSSSAAPPSTEMANNVPAPAPGSVTGNNSAPATSDIAAGKTRESSRKKSKDAASTMKPGKKEKIRFGQAPRETLPGNDNTRNIDAHATTDSSSAATDSSSAAPDQMQVAAADIPPESPAAPREGKKRYSARAKLPKVKKSKTPPVDPLAPPPPTDEETATQKTQDQPLGLAGDTMKPAKVKKPKPTEKTRLQDGKKPLSTNGGTTNGETPAATDQTPAPSSAPAAPLETNPVQTPPTGRQGVPTPGDGSSTTPPPPPQ